MVAHKEEEEEEEEEDTLYRYFQSNDDVNKKCEKKREKGRLLSSFPKTKRVPKKILFSKTLNAFKKKIGKNGKV